jgi:hypothetical protein
MREGRAAQAVGRCMENASTKTATMPNHLISIYRMTCTVLLSRSKSSISIPAVFSTSLLHSLI